MSPSHRPPGEGAAASPGRRVGVGAVVFALIAVVSIAAASFYSVRAAGTGDDLRSNLTYIAPAGVGGGWDSFAREGQ